MRQFKKYDKYKDSELAWLGIVPSSWEVRRLKDVCYMNSGETITANEFLDEGYPVGNGLTSIDTAMIIPMNKQY